MLCAPYDAELFGHWWFEGNSWLYYVLKWMSEDPELRLATLSESLDDYGPSTVITLPEGSWGEGGFHWIWLNDWTTWTWRHVYDAEAEMQSLSREFAERQDPELQKILRQTARELLLLESSDWQFLISTWSARDYAEMRCAEHFESFRRLAEMTRRYGRNEGVNPEDWNFLGACEERDKLFPDVNPLWWAHVEYPPVG